MAGWREINFMVSTGIGGREKEFEAGIFPEFMLTLRLFGGRYGDGVERTT